MEAALRAVIAYALRDSASGPVGVLDVSCSSCTPPEMRDALVDATWVALMQSSSRDATHAYVGYMRKAAAFQHLGVLFPCTFEGIAGLNNM
jgi:hypothetical protein